MYSAENIRERFEKLGEYYAAGLFEDASAAPFARYSRGMRRYLENRPMPEYNGETLYPCGSVQTSMCLRHDYSFTVQADMDALEQKDAVAAQALKEELDKYRSLVPAEHTVGGNMYTHSIPNFPRIVREGLDSYEKRIEGIADADIRNGLTDVLEGIRCFHTRSLELLREKNAPAELIGALEKVPFAPADTLYEALVCWNFIYYMDGCDNIGRLDADLIDYYRGEDMTEVIRRFFLNVDANNAWSGALGPDYNELTIQCLKACKGIRRPSIELRIVLGMPGEVWDAAIEAIRAGGGSPSLYNEDGYQTALAELFPDAPRSDLIRFSGGGCTETMLAGVSNVGSLDAGVNVALVFERFMRRALPTAKSFEEFYSAYMAECRETTLEVLDAVSASQKLRAEFRPQPMRTLLMDDCIEKGRDFNNGGTRYAWSVVNIAGLINVIDSMLVINKLVFEDKAYDGASLIAAMDAGENFLGYPGIPRHGTDSDIANAMAARVSRDICAPFAERTPYSGGRFLASSIQFTTYLDAGRHVGATPDGRTAGAPLCDSIGAIHGNDNLGATALLNSAGALCQKDMAGTPVLNIKLDAKQTAKTLRPLVNAYFRNGGMQLQVTCINAEELLDAREHPEKYPNLIVRIGGYSEYFTRLSPELQQTVIDRTLYGM